MYVLMPIFTFFFALASWDYLNLNFLDKYKKDKDKKDKDKEQDSTSDRISS